MLMTQGSVRRKKKVLIREHANDEKKIQSVLRKIGLSEIPNIDEVAVDCLNCLLLPPPAPPPLLLLLLVPGMGQYCSQLQLNYNYITFQQLQLQLLLQVQLITARPVTITSTKWSITITITCTLVSFACHNSKHHFSINACQHLYINYIVQFILCLHNSNIPHKVLLKLVLGFIQWMLNWNCVK